MDIDFNLVGSELSDDELLSIFKKIISLNFGSKIKYDILKISNIKAETKYGGKTVSVGYDNQLHFSRAFKSVFGGLTK